MKYYIVQLPNGSYLKYVSGRYFSSCNDPLKAKKFKLLKKAIENRDKIETHPYFPYPNSKVLELSVEMKELDA